MKKSNVITAVLVCAAITAAAGTAAGAHTGLAASDKNGHYISLDHSAKKISLSEAKKKALKDAGVKASDASFTKAKAVTDDGVKIYDIEFHTDDTEYEYEIRVSDGKIMEKSSEAYKKPVSSKKVISEASAKKKALDDAGVKASDVLFTKIKADVSDGVKIYDIEFHTDDTEYEYEIKASNGKILEKSSEAYEKKSSSHKISLKEAKKIARRDAGVKETDVLFRKEKLDFDDGIYIYEIEFCTDDTEYEYEINAETGKIISKDSESIYDD